MLYWMLSPRRLQATTPHGHVVSVQAKNAPEETGWSVAGLEPNTWGPIVQAYSLLCGAERWWRDRSGRRIMYCAVTPSSAPRLSGSEIVCERSALSIVLSSSQSRYLVTPVTFSASSFIDVCHYHCQLTSSLVLISESLSNAGASPHRARVGARHTEVLSFYSVSGSRYSDCILCVCGPCLSYILIMPLSSCDCGIPILLLVVVEV